MSVVSTVFGLALLGLGGYALARLWFRQPKGISSILAGAMLAWIWLTIGTLVLGLVGSLNRASLLGWAIPALIPIILFYFKPRDPDSSNPSELAEPLGWDSGLAMGLTLWATLALAIPSIVLAVKVVSDGPIYHLYFAAKWWKAGRIFLIPTPFGESAAPYFPAVGDLWHTWLFVVWGGDTLAKVGQAPFLGLASLAVFDLSRRGGAGRNASIIATCLFATVSPLLLFSFEPNVDTLFVAGYLIAIDFGLRFFLGGDGSKSLLLAALAAGAAWGCKAPGIVFIPPILGLAIVGLFLKPASRLERLRNLAIVLLAPLVMEGYWLVRNAMLTGNPFYPLQLAFGGITVLHGWYGTEAMTTSPYYLHWQDWRSGIDLFLNVFDPRVVPFGVLALSGAWRLGRSRTTTDRWVWISSGLAILNMGLYWFAIPYRTQLRFLLHAGGLTAVPIALLIDRGRGLRWLAVTALAFHVLTPQGWPFGASDHRIPWDLSELIPNASPSPVPFFADIAGLLSEAGMRSARMAGAKLATGVGCLVWGVGLVWASRGKSTRRIVALTAGLSLCLAQAYAETAGRPQVVFRFPIFPAYIQAWMDLDGRIPSQGARIAYAGTNLPYYLMGKDFRNDVRYVNVNPHRDWLLHDYHREAHGLDLPTTWPDTRPGWDRAKPDYSAWLANLRDERIQFLFTARANPEEGLHNVMDSQGFTIERRWADAHPDVFRLRYADRNVRLYFVLPPR
jgi:hypothetical protein